MAAPRFQFDKPDKQASSRPGKAPKTKNIYYIPCPKCGLSNKRVPCDYCGGSGFVEVLRDY
jgi:hypothetical protein